MKVRIVRLHRYNATAMTDAPRKPFWKQTLGGPFWAGLAVRFAGLGMIWIGDGHNRPFRKGLVIAGVVLSVGGITILRYLLLAPLLSRLRHCHELPVGDAARTPRKSFWKRKRWIAAAAVLWLVLVYPLLEGPARYFSIRGWVSRDFYGVIWHRPLHVILPAYRVQRFPNGTVAEVASSNPFARARGVYLHWWDGLAIDHAWPDAGLSLPHP
jgi:hypothetical protein